MYIVVKSGLLSIVEYGTTVSVVDCVQFAVYVNQCVRPSCSLRDSAYPQKKPDTHHIMYHFYSMKLGFVNLIA